LEFAGVGLGGAEKAPPPPTIHIYPCFL
jgi:hypothetical protein